MGISRWPLAVAVAALTAGALPVAARACPPSYWYYDLTSLPDCVGVEGEIASGDTSDTGEDEVWYDTAVLYDGIELHNGCEETLSFTVQRPDDLQAPSSIPAGETGFIAFDDSMNVNAQMTWHMGEESGPLEFEASVSHCGESWGGGSGCHQAVAFPASSLYQALFLFGVVGLGLRKRD